MADDNKKRKQDQAKPRGASLTVRDLPLERFRLPGDGRKWKCVAQARASLLQYIALWANDDGSFLKDRPGQQPRNYSPSEKRLTQRFSSATLYRHTRDLYLLDLLEWDRKNRHERRVYRITADRPYPTDFQPREKHLSDSGEPDLSNSTPEVSNSTSPDLSNSIGTSHIRSSDLSHSQSGPLTSECDPLVSSGFPLEHQEPPYIPPAAKTAAMGDMNGAQLFSWGTELLAVTFGKRKRLPSLARLFASPAQDVADFLTVKGFAARIVTEPTLMPGHLIDLRAQSENERSMCAGSFSRTTEDYRARMQRNAKILGLTYPEFSKDEN